MAQAYPARPITLTLPWAAGGGTDATARMVGSLIERELKQPVNVVNRTGGSGVVGHAALAGAAADGYTIGMVTVEIAMMHHQGLTDLTPASYTPLALLINNPPGVMVGAGSPHKDIRSLADAIKASPPGRLKASGTGQGGIWHIALAGWLQAMGLKPDHVAWVPSQGAAPAMQDLAAGGIDLATCALPEGRTMIEAGKVRPLAVMAPQRNPLFPAVPTLTEGMGIDYSAGGWAGLAAPPGLPADIRDRLIAVIKNAFDSAEYGEFIRNRGFVSQWAGGDDFAKFMAVQDEAMGRTMRAAGLAKT
jgi:tripartite-type tricarboxylate transporter receptor subunit TctC